MSCDPTRPSRSRVDAAPPQYRIEPCLAIVVRKAPCGAHESALLEAHETWIQRAHVEPERAAGHLLQACCDGIAVQRPERGHGLQHHQVKRSLQHLNLGPLSVSHPNGVSVVSISLSNGVSIPDTSSSVEPRRTPTTNGEPDMNRTAFREVDRRTRIAGTQVDGSQHLKGISCLQSTRNHLYWGAESEWSCPSG